MKTAEKLTEPAKEILRELCAAPESWLPVDFDGLTMPAVRELRLLGLVTHDFERVHATGAGWYVAEQQLTEC